MQMISAANNAAKSPPKANRSPLLFFPANSPAAIIAKIAME